MAAIPPNTYIDGFIKSMQDGVYGVFNKGVKYGRYLEQQEHPLIRCNKCEFEIPDPRRREGILYCCEWECLTRNDGYCHNASKRMDAEENA